jgi:hypothetical protein
MGLEATADLLLQPVIHGVVAADCLSRCLGKRGAAMMGAAAAGQQQRYRGANSSSSPLSWVLVVVAKKTSFDSAVLVAGEASGTEDEQPATARRNRKPTKRLANSGITPRLPLFRRLWAYD